MTRFDPSRELYRRPIYFFWSRGQSKRVTIPDGFRLVFLAPGKSPSVVPTELMAPGAYYLAPEPLPGGSYPFAITTCDAAHVDVTERIAPNQVDYIFARAKQEVGE